MTPWEVVNRRLLAKCISELHFEEVLIPDLLEDDVYSLKLNNGAEYRFRAQMSQWGHLWVYENSLSQNSAAQFFIDSQFETGMSDITLGNFLEELNNTLRSDLHLLKLNKNVEELASLHGYEVEQFLNGHPKLLLNKGRIGWGESDSKLFSPESGRTFRLNWILVSKDLLVGSEIEEIVSDLDVPTDYKAIPVHPWQWDRVIKTQFINEIQSGQIIDLGERGDIYRPQVSIRTLSNARKASLPDIKLPLSVLNTSCVRGLPHKYLTITPELGLRLKNLIEHDDILSNRGVDVLLEKAAWGVKHPIFNQISNAPYRYHEQLGAVWRESVQSKLKEGEKGIIAACLIHQDDDGKTLISEYVKRSGISLKEWLRRYAQFVIIPLLHLQNRYGVGLVAHGQNVVLKLNDFVPTGLFLKDFHGDLRLSNAHEEIHKEYFGDLANHLTKLPPEHLIHDLITGHFVTLLRFIAGALESSGEMDEMTFYEIISSELKSYYDSHACSNPLTNVLAPKFSRVLVNSVRFKIGYGDTSERPLPILGTDLRNPFCGDKK